ncbi:hypothetical protein EYF80_013829 [Liparis tanakae]|uniref:Uncharacterized protein n=1 Tax=Liparis tanakae TaxID=230148 RepID=A0A4Z2ICQ5_9TELE|nr:hypothetical protein EYF80_013829 [Liparis tanakae]
MKRSCDEEKLSEELFHRQLPFHCERTAQRQLWSKGLHTQQRNARWSLHRVEVDHSAPYRPSRVIV